MMTPKKFHRFLIGSVPPAETWVIDDEHIVHQILSVLKFSVGESFVVFEDGGDNTTVRIVDRDKKTMTVTTLETHSVAELPRTVIAAVSIAKGASFELAVQKLTEVGVSAIVPLLSDRTVKQAVRIDRLQKISNEALEQSGGNRKVTIHEPMTLAESFAAFPFAAVVCDAYGETADMTVPDTVVMYVGPEGGWSDNDEAVFAEHDIQHLKCGNTILRTETAAIIGAHLLLWQY